MNAHHKPGEVSSALHSKRADEQVEDCGGEDYEGRYVVQVIQARLQGTVIQVSAACDTHTRTHTVERERVHTTPDSGHTGDFGHFDSH